MSNFEFKSQPNAAQLHGLVVANGTSDATAIKTNLNAVLAPGVNDDVSQGYGVFSPWVFAGDVYLCVDASPGAAVWNKVETPDSAAIIALKQQITAVNTFAVGNVLRQSGSSYVLAKADNDTDAFGVVGVVESATANSFVLVSNGILSYPGHGFAVGSLLYLSGATAGALTTTSANRRVLVGVAATANTVFLYPQGLVGGVGLYGADAGAVNAVVFSVSPSPTAYENSQRFIFLPANTNTAAVTVNVNSLGATPLLLGANALTGGEVVAGRPAYILFDGTNFQLLNPAIGSNAIANANLAQMAAQTFKGNGTGAPGTPQDLSSAQVTALLRPVIGDSGSGGTQGMVPTPPLGSAAANLFLAANGGFKNTGFSGLQIFTASGTFTIPQGVDRVLVEVLGGGGAGGTTSGANEGCGGGGAGAYGKRFISGLTPGATVAVTIGAGGVHSSTSTGGAGGTSSFGAYVSCTGGSGGVGGGSSVSPGGSGGVGGVATSADVNVPGEKGKHGYCGSSMPSLGGSGGSSIYGAAGAGAASASAGAAGGTATGYGAGGGGAATESSATAAGGNGAPGLVLIYY